MNKRKIWTVYMHVVPKEISKYKHDKYYIGITSKLVQRRWKNGNGYKGSVFEKAINKYGWENIRHEILIENLTQEEACEYEQNLIKLLRSTEREYGYNVAEGGMGVKRPSIPVAKYKVTGELVEVYDSFEDAVNIGGMGLGLAIGNVKLSNGFQWRHTTNGKVSNKIEPYNKGRHVRIARYDLDGNLIDTFANVSTASKKIGFFIHVDCSTSHGYMFRRIPDGESPLPKIPPYAKHDNAKTVEVYDLKGNKIEECPSIVAAQRKYHLKNICAYCSGTHIALNKYQFKIKGSTKIIKDLSREVLCKPVYLYNLNGNYIGYFPSVNKALFFIYGERKSLSVPEKFFKSIYANAYVGYRWCHEYVEKMPPLIQFDERYNPVVQLDINNKPINIFASASLAAKAVGMPQSSPILKCCNNHECTGYGYKWRYFSEMCRDDFNGTPVYDKYLIYKDILTKRKGVQIA